MAKKAKTSPKSASKAVGSLSAAELARLCNMSLTRVYAELAQGRSAFEVVATAQRRKQRAAAREVPLLPVDVDLVVPTVNGKVPVNGGVPAYSESLAAKEQWAAELKKIEVMQKRGELMPVSYARLWGTRFLVAAKDEMLKGPGEIQDALATESDPFRCRVIVERWVERVLAKFCELEKLWGPPMEGDDAA